MFGRLTGHLYVVSCTLAMTETTPNEWSTMLTRNLQSQSRAYNAVQVITCDYLSGTLSIYIDINSCIPLLSGCQRWVTFTTVKPDLEVLNVPTSGQTGLHSRHLPFKLLKWYLKTAKQGRIIAQRYLCLVLRQCMLLIIARLTSLSLC